MPKPYIDSVKLSRSEWIAQFGISLDSIVATAEAGDARSAQISLNRQADLIATLVGIGQQAGVEIRVKSRPDPESPFRGEINVAMRIKTRGGTKAGSRQKAQALFDQVMPHLVSLSDEYSWSAIGSESSFKDIFDIKSNWQVRELTRREAYLSIDLNAQKRDARGIGFITEPEKKNLPAQHPYVCFPFIRSYDRWRDLFIELLYQKEPVVLSVGLWPTQATNTEKKFLFEQMLHCERLLQMPLSGPIGDLEQFYPALRSLASVVQDHTQKSILSLEDDVYFAQVLVATHTPASRLLLESIGVSMTEHVSTTDPASDVTLSTRPVIGGGFVWLHPKSDAQRARTLKKLNVLSHAATDKELADPKYRIRRLMDIPQANCVFRLPVPTASTFPGLNTRLYRELPPPAGTEQGGLFFGRNQYRSNRQSVHMLDKDRLRHTYILGMTGTGKSTLLKNLILQDICAGKGTGVFDPHGELIDEILPCIPPERRNDIVLIRPSDDDALFGLNILEVQSDLEKDAAINFLLEVFERLYDMSNVGGPMFEQYFRNGLLLLMSEKGAHPTIMDFERIFTDPKFRKAKVEQCGDGRVRDFWTEIAQKIGGDHSLINVSAYVSSKLTRMTSSILIRKIVSQRKSTLDFKAMLNKKKILLVDLSKGELGDTNSSFLGMLLLKRIQQTAFARSKKSAQSSPFHLYVDEFQNLATDSFIAMLSEGRKYGLAITLANQYLNQIPEAIRDSITGNVGSFVSFRLGYRDAELVAANYEPLVSRSDLASIPNYHAYVRFLVQGNTSDPTNIVTENTDWAVSIGKNKKRG